MNAVFMDGVESIELRKAPIPTPGPAEALLKVHACTVCGSDIKIFRYGNKRLKYPVIVGHEIAGEIVEAGPQVRAVKVGDRVAVGADVPGVWNENVRGEDSFIDYATGHEFDGGFAQYMLLNQRMLEFGPVTHIPDHLSYDAASLGEPLACAIKGLEFGHFGPGKSIAVIGLGPIGCMILELAQAYSGGQIFAIQRSRPRLEAAKRFAPNARFICTQDENPVETVLAETNGAGVDMVITTSGSVEAHKDAIDMVGHLGYVNFFGGLRGQPPLTFDSNIIHYKECFVMGTHGSDPTHHKEAIRLLSSGAVHGEWYVSETFPLSRIMDAYEFHEAHKGLKAIVHPWDEAK
jgi:L-iditol 2-dehydrogenase